MLRDKILISDHYKQSFEKIKSEILRENDTTIIGTDIEELTQYYFDKYCLRLILIDEEQETTWDPKKYMKTIYAHERERPYQCEGNLDFECEKINVEIPIIQYQDI